ncbi:hypothetical protein RN001_004036 [Aquatica leii]|uniref:Uncharacterized protein n=1 Tax=Aquatica leii TaxID=1421715 RepID=A0AAN7QC45_9COLE|nr:hypothetical protein RN001_004036 [Aquatica leii]
MISSRHICDFKSDITSMTYRQHNIYDTLLRSYEKARNIAAESDYTSITEILGRGCRISKPTDAERQYNKRFASPVVNGFTTDEDEEQEKNKKIDNCTYPVYILRNGKKLVCRIGENGADFMKNVFTLIYDDKFAAENTWMGKKNKLNLSELKFNKTKPFNQSFLTLLIVILPVRPENGFGWKLNVTSAEVISLLLLQKQR